MRRKIWRMSEDRFDPAPAAVQFDSGSIDCTAVEGEETRGSFSFSTTEETPLRGMVFSSNPYVAVENPSFEGTAVTVRFFVTISGTRAGDVLSGDFYIILQGRTFDLPYRISYVAKDLTMDGEVIRTPEDFAALYKKDPAAALALFLRPEFSAFARRAGKEFELLYRGYRTFPNTADNMEEFLTGAGLKDRVHFDISETSLSYNVGPETERRSLSLTRSTWGYLKIQVTCDGDFVTLSQSTLTGDFFVGSLCKFDFFLHPDRMHAGRNYCRIVFSGNSDVRTLTLLCTKAENGVSRDDRRRILFRGSLALTETYLDYRFGRISAEDWREKTLAALDPMEAVSDEQEALLYKLIRTQILISSDEKQEALSMVEDLRADILDRRSFEWAYLLYLCTLLERDKSYVDRLTAEVEGIFREREGDVRIFWLLLFLREEYVTNGMKELSDIRQFVQNGCSSPFLYVEALAVLKKDPLLIREFDPFTLRILTWGARRGKLTGNISMRIASLLGREKAFDSRVFFLVRKCYGTNPSQELLDAALRYLLRSSVYGPEVFPWYALAVKSGLSLTGLYEAYVCSLPEDYFRPLPEEVLRYFGYSNTLSFDRKAMVFASMITNKAACPAVYEETKKTVEAFALEMMRHRRLDENLAVIYQDVLDRGIIDSDVAAMMADFLVPVEIFCSIPSVRRIILVTDDLEEPLMVPVIGGRAFCPVSCSSRRIFLEMDGGLYLSEKGFVRTQEMMDLKRILPRLKQEAKNPLPYFRYDLNFVHEAEEIGRENADSLDEFLNSPSIRNAYKTDRFPLFISYLRSILREDIFERYLLRETDYSGLDTQTICYIIDLFAIGGNMEKAWSLLKTYCGLKATGRTLLSLVTGEIEKNPSRADDFLVAFAAYLMGQYLDNETTVSYLGAFYVGPESVMAEIFKHLAAYSLPAEALAGRAVTEMLYTETFPAEGEQIFEAYFSAHPNRMVIEAWVTYWAHAYLKHQKNIPATVFDHLKDFYQRGEKLNESCLVGLLAWLCRKDDLSDREKKLLSDLLSEAIRKNLYFDFYRKAPDDLKIRFHLYDKYFITYEGAEGQRIDVSLKNKSGSSIRAEMVEMVPGIYVCQFVLFFGDKAAYEICLRDEPDQVLKSGEVSCTDDFPGGEGSRYGLINRMRSGLVYSDDRQTKDSMKRFSALDAAVRELYSLR